MLKGMTGFAQADYRFKDIQINMEIRSLNHRFLECQIHTPDGFGAAEELIKDRIKPEISRGRVTVILSVTNLHPKVSVNSVLADNYVRELRNLNQKLKLENNLTLSHVMTLEGILGIEKIAVTAELIHYIKMLSDRILDKLVAMRHKEGRAISSDILKRLELIKRETAKITLYVKSVNSKKKKQLSEEELGVFIKNTDITEELTRIRYHLNNFTSTLKKSSSCGKELDFIAQEIQREANTISAKAQSAKTSSSVVKIKSAIDKIREQVQNVE